MNPGSAELDAADAAKSPPQGKRRNLLLRLASALAALALMYAVLRWDIVHASGWAWAGLLAAYSVPGLREFHRMARACGMRPFGAFAMIAGPLWMLSFELDFSPWAASRLPLPPSSVLFAAIAAGTVLLQLTRKTNDGALANAAVTVFGLAYICFLPGFLIRMRHLALGPAGWPGDGIEFVVACIFVSKVADVGALMIGSRWGRRKLIPRLSPNKTWEGALGGLAFSVFLLQFMVWAAPQMALAGLGTGNLLLLSCLMAAGGLGGDLVESCFKRNGNFKDAGAGVPGFGGVLDLVDSLMVAGPAMFLFLVANGAK